jgi:hypothetical protein
VHERDDRSPDVGDMPLLHGPSARGPFWRGGRPRKRWRYVAVFNEELMACAAVVQVGPARQSFWALYLRGEDRMRERTRMLRPQRAVDVATGRVRIRDGGVALDLELEEGDGWSARCRDGAGEVRTRKQAGAPARGTLALDGAPERAVDALAVIDDTVGYHARRTEWWWSAGVGRTPGGVAVGWNLVSGINDPPSGSERAVWVAGSPGEAGPVTFAPDFSCIRCEDGAKVRFAPEAQRARHENLLLIKSDYRAPFGSFSGTLPGGVELEHGLGVVEHHRALW